MVRELCDPARPVEATRVPAGERVDLDARARVRGVDEPAVADVHPDVPEPVEEDEVSRPQRSAGDAPAEIEVGIRAVRQVDAEVRVDEAHEARAIEARARRGAAVDVRNAEQ